MEAIDPAESAMIAYCFGHPERLSNGTNHFEETIAELRRDGHDWWDDADRIGLVEQCKRWYVWVKRVHDDGAIEGKVYAFDHVEAALQHIFDDGSIQDPEQRMRLVRRIFTNLR